MWNLETSISGSNKGKDMITTATYLVCSWWRNTNFGEELFEEFVGHGIFVIFR